MKSKIKGILAVLIALVVIFFTFHIANSLIYDLAAGIAQPLHAVIIVAFWMIAFTTIVGISIAIALGLILLIAWIFNW